uniref:Uncharacterized protein n=1 Tax=Anopheles atroparvus TaxID=41427 RepID=A0AAG5DT09_ANOAO
MFIILYYIILTYILFPTSEQYGRNFDSVIRRARSSTWHCHRDDVTERKRE